jgi:hypothetical protein
VIGVGGDEAIDFSEKYNFFCKGIRYMKWGKFMLGFLSGRLAHERERVWEFKIIRIRDGREGGL